jgi:hypothetical protein
VQGLARNVSLFMAHTGRKRRILEDHIKRGDDPMTKAIPYQTMIPFKVIRIDYVTHSDDLEEWSGKQQSHLIVSFDISTALAIFDAEMQRHEESEWYVVKAELLGYCRAVEIDNMGVIGESFVAGQPE